MVGLLRVRWAVLAALVALSWTPVTARAQSDADSLLRRADADARAGRFDSARQSYEAAMRQGASLEQDAVRSQLLAQSYANSSPKDLLSAIRWFRNALRLSGDERVRAELADTMVRAGEYGDAAEQYQVLAKAHPASTIYIIALSRALLQAGRAEDALQALQSWLAQTPGTTAVRLEYARILSYQKHFAEARQQYETVLRTEPSNLVAQIGVAKVTSWQGDQETALSMYDRVLTRNPSNYDALVGKAFSLLWMGRQGEALPLLQTAANRNPNDSDVREALSHLHGVEPMPSIAAAPPALPEVPAAAAFAQGATAPPISVPPPTSLPEIAPAQRSAGATAFAPGAFNAVPSARNRSKASHRKAAAPKEEPAASPQPAAPEPEPERNVFGIGGASNARIAVILFIIVVVLIGVIFTMSSRDKESSDDWHDNPRPVQNAVKVSRPHPQEQPAVRHAPAPSKPEPSPATNGDRRPVARTAPVVPAQKPLRESPPPPTTPATTPIFATEIRPRSADLAPQVRLDGLRVLVVGSEEVMVKFERRVLEGAGAKVLVEADWKNAVARMAADGVHAIVVNDEAGDQPRRIYQSVVQDNPGWLRRLLLVLTDDNGPTRQFMLTCQAKCILQPFQSAELLTVLGGMFGMTPRGDAVSAGQ